MSLQDNVMSAMKAAMKEKNQTALAALRAVKSEILLAKTASDGTDELTEEQLSDVVVKYSQVTRFAKGAQANRKAGRRPTPKQLAAEEQVLDSLIPFAIASARAEGLSLIFEPLESLYSIPRDDPRFIPGSMSAQLGLEQDRKGNPTRIFFKVGDPQGGRSEDSISISDLSKVLAPADVNLLIGIARKNQEPRTVPRSQ